MRPQTCIVRGPLALVLRIMRVLSLAPVSIARERTGHRIRVCKRYAYVGYVFIILLNILNCIYVWIEMKVKHKYPNITEKLPLLLLLKILDESVGIIISALGALFSVTRMNNLIEQVYYMEQEIPAHRRKVNNKIKRVILLMFMSRAFLEVIKFLRNLIIMDSEIDIHAYFFSRIKYVLITAVQIYIFAMYEELLSKIRIVREEVQDLADLLEYEYIPSASFTESTNARLWKIRGKIEFLKKIFEKMNQCNQYTAFFIYISFISRFILAVFDSSRIIMPEALTVSIIFRIIFVLYHAFSLVLFVEPFQGIGLEVQTIKLQVARMATTEYVTDSIPAPLDTLYDELSTMDMTFSPLGVFTVRRSLLAKSLGAALSYLVIVIQFKVA